MIAAGLQHAANSDKKGHRKIVLLQVLALFRFVVFGFCPCVSQYYLG